MCRVTRPSNSIVVLGHYRTPERTLKFEDAAPKHPEVPLITDENLRQPGKVTYRYIWIELNLKNLHGLENYI